MSDALDEGLVQRIDARGTIEWSETCYRYTGAHRDALSGEGARRFGGRWNPPLLFPAIYLADSAQACMVEVERAAQAASTTAEKMLEAAYRLHDRRHGPGRPRSDNPASSGSRGSRTTTSMATTGQGARRSDMRPGSCTCKVSSCRRRAVSASLSPRMNSELGRANYNCDKASI